MTNRMLKFLKLDPNAKIPAYASGEAAGMDISSNGNFIINPGSFVRVTTGLAAEIPVGYELQVRPRSGLAAKYGVTVLNAPGTIDSDYRGEIQVILINHGTGFFYVNPGDRIAQLVFARVERAIIETTNSLRETERGSGGFGSTGIS